MSECIFCHEETEERLLKAISLPVCSLCKVMYEVVKAIEDSPSTVLFVCKACGYKGEVAGTHETTIKDGLPVTVTKVDDTHKYCQKCGTPSRGSAVANV